MVPFLVFSLDLIQNETVTSFSFGKSLNSTKSFVLPGNFRSKLDSNPKERQVICIYYTIT